MAHVDRDCFAIWFRGTEPEAAAVELQALCYALGAEIAAGDLTVVPEVEVGTALYPADAERAGRLDQSRPRVASPGPARTGARDRRPANPPQIARERFSLEQDLRHAIDREQLEMVFQPVVDLSQGRGRRRGAAALAAPGSGHDLARRASSRSSRTPT